VPNPLPRNEDRHLHVKLDLRHFERSGVIVTQKVTNERAIVTHTLGPGAIRNARGLNHRVVSAHIIDDPDKSVVQNGELMP